MTVSAKSSSAGKTPFVSVANMPPISVALPTSPVVVLLSGMVAGWLAADSVGMMALALRRSLIYAAFLLAVLAAWPAVRRTATAWGTLIGGVLLGTIFLYTDSSSVSGVFAVTIAMAAIACSTQNAQSRAALWAALGTCMLGCFHLASTIPATWLLFDGLGGLIGRLAGWASGPPLQVGKTFVGLDFIVLSGVVIGLALHATQPPRWGRICGAVVAVAAGHFAYLVLLAQADNLLALLPAPLYPRLTTENQVGLWTWGNFLRSLVPWHLPPFALLIHLCIAAGFSQSVLRPLPEEEEKTSPQKPKLYVKPAAGPRENRLPDILPALLLGVAALFCTATGSTWSLQGKTILAFEQNPGDWRKPEYDSASEGDFGLLPELVESLGGKLIRTQKLEDEELKRADVLLLLPPMQLWTSAMSERVWQYVREGGMLLLAAAPADIERQTFNNLNQLLEPTAIRLRRDTATPRTLDWEEALETLPHPATAGGERPGRRFGFRYGSSLKVGFPARPLLLGKWGWSDPGSEAALFSGARYEPGERLGDIVLAAEQQFGQGRIIMLGDATVLQNETLAESYSFVSQLLGYLAHKSSSPQVLWRQVAAIAVLLAAIYLVFHCRKSWAVIFAGATVAIMLLLCKLAADATARPLPNGHVAANTAKSTIKLAYVDASHLEAFSRDLWAEHGLAGLLRTLIRHGYLPLFAPDLESDRLERAELLFLIGPAGEFSPVERERLKKFVNSGGTLIVLAGAEQSRPVNPLLEEFRLRVPYSPVPPGDNSFEPAPLGAFAQLFGKAEYHRYVQFYAAWPVEYDKNRGQPLVVWSDGKQDLPVVVVHDEGLGQVVLIGDTFFAGNLNLEDRERSLPDNIRFWRWLLSHVVPGQEPWEPPPRAPGEDRERNEDSDEEAEEEAAP